MDSATLSMRFDALASATARPIRQDREIVCSTTHFFVWAEIIAI